MIPHIGKKMVFWSDIWLFDFYLFRTSEVLPNFGKSSEISEVAPKPDFGFFFEQTIFFQYVEISEDPGFFNQKLTSQNALARKFRVYPLAGAQKSHQALFLEAKSLIFLDFIDPARAPRSHLVGATKKSSPYGTFRISSWTQKSALEIAAQMQLQRFYFKHEE